MVVAAAGRVFAGQAEVSRSGKGEEGRVRAGGGLPTLPPCRALTQAVPEVARGTTPGDEAKQQSLGREGVGAKGKGGRVSKQSGDRGTRGLWRRASCKQAAPGLAPGGQGRSPVWAPGAGSRAGAVGMRHAAASHVLSMHRAEARGAAAASPAGHASRGPTAEPEPGQRPAICWAGASGQRFCAGWVRPGLG